MSNKLSLPHLMAQLRSLSQVAEDITGDEVDWIVPARDVDSTANRVLQMMGLAEADAGAVAAQRHTIKGKFEGIAKRIGGLSDFVDDGEVRATATGLEQIIKELTALYEVIGKQADKEDQIEKQREAEEKAQRDQDQAQQAQNPGAQQDTGGDEQAPNQAPQARGQQTPSFRGQIMDKTQSAAPARQQRESTFLINGDTITESNKSDPFGFGEKFMSDVRRASGIRGKK